MIQIDWQYPWKCVMKYFLFLLFPFLTLYGLAQTPEISPMPPAGKAIYFDADRTAASFKKGEPLFLTNEYKVMAGHREKPGDVEFHTYDTDFFYVVDGTATFVVGGKGIGMKEIAPGEFRGTSIEGGEAFHLKKGDVIIVPKGTPHQYTEVNVSFD
jgi:mannose-6-phosphate isomerase-like protein (cupin superfamily)